MSNQPNSTLSPEYVDALNAVNLQMAFGNHGYAVPHSEHGLMLLGVDDREYRDIDKFVGNMNAQQGDVLALEASGYYQPWSAATLSAAHLGVDNVTPYLKTAAFEGLDEMDPKALARYYRLARNLRILGPLDYAEGKAVEKGVQVAFADATATELVDWVDRKDTDFRDGRMVARLGEIASDMGTNGKRARLKFVAGSNHRPGVERILTNSGVNYSVTRFGSAKGVREGIFDAQWSLHQKFPDRISSPVKRHVTAWERNLKSKQK